MHQLNFFLLSLLLICLTTVHIEAQELLDVKCTDEEKTVSDKRLSIRTCQYGDLKSIRIGSPNDQGHFRYSYELFQQKNDQHVAIAVTELLRNQDRLLEIINRKLGLDYTELLEDPISGPCLAGQNDSPVFQWNDLGFTFDEFGFHFHANFPVKENCVGLEHSTVSFTPSKIKRYLKN